MSALSFDLDANKAREGSGGGSQRIDASGAYVGTITQAIFTENQNGTKGVAINFEDQSGAVARFTLWVQNGKGEAIYGEKKLHALMTCLQVRSLTPVQGKATVYQDGQVQDIQAQLYPDLMNKPVGMLFQAEEYEGQNGVRTRMNLIMPFDAQSRRCAQEILDKQEASTVDKVAATIKDKPLQPTGTSGGQSLYASQDAPSADFDDDIPF